MKDSIKEWVNLIVFVIAAILIIMFKNNLFVVGCIIGVSLAIMGLSLIISKNRGGFLPLCGGICLSITLLLFKFNILDKYDSITFCIVSAFGLILLISLIFDYVNEKVALKHFDKEVTCKVVDLIKNPNTKGDYFKPVYEYEIEGKVLRVEGLVYSNKFIPKIGDKLVIHVSSEDITDVYFNKSLSEKIWGNLLSLVLVIICIVIVVSLFV